MESTKLTDVRNGEDYNQWGLVVKVFSLNSWSNVLVTNAGTEEVCTGKK